ncbi:Protein Jade-3, partial [Tinamus guttatus]
QVFRKDLISAMKLPDSHHVNSDEYYIFADTWKQEGEKAVQVPASPETIPQPSLRIVAEKVKEVLYTRPRKYIHCSSQEPTEPGYINILELAESVCRYDLDDMDIFWLQELNEELTEMGCGPLDENTMERTIEVLERHCHENMNHAIETEEGLGIEYDEDVICDVCRSPDSEDGNDMVFCDKCNICVHQACYGILKVPEGSWLCRTCVLGIHPQCLLCPKRGGAMKATRTGTKWAHVSCALWIPEVSIACPERMEPITKVSHIPPSRWALVCSLCKLKTGACIQCSVKSCITAFHVTCAFEHSLEMKTILDDGDEVKFKSYCLKHSKNKQNSLPDIDEHPKSVSDQKQTESEKTSLRAQKLRELEEEFYSLVKVEDVAAELGLPKLAVDFIYNYWKLKRKSNFNKPLFPPKEDEENGLVQPKEDSIHTRMRMFMHLRQDLERVRNLCYMVSRREKLKLSHSKVHEQVFNLQVQLINQEIAAGHTLTSALENTLFYPPPRITLKLKMPKSALGDCRNHALKPGSQTPYEQEPVLAAHLAGQSGFRRATMEHFSRSFKEATNSLVRTTEDLRCCEKPPRRLAAKERLWSKAPLEGAPYQDNDGYCPDLELSDSEAESDENKEQVRLRRSSSERDSPSKDFGRDCHNRNKKNMISHGAVQR